VLFQWRAVRQYLLPVSFLCLFGFCTPLYAAALALNESEQAYLRAHSQVSLCVDPDWWPFEHLGRNGQHEGIAADLIALVAERTGLNIQLFPTVDWEASLAASQAGECMALSFLNSTPERERWLIFTEPLLEDPNVLITREDTPFISDVAQLQNVGIALPRGTAMAERFARDFPHIRIIGTASEQEALQLVVDRKADMSLRSLVVAAHTIRSEGWFNLKISGEVPGYHNQLRMGVLKSETTLRDILNKGVASITDTERMQIVARHTGMQVVAQKVTDWRLVSMLMALLLAVVITSLFWHLRLRRLNRRLAGMARTDALTGVGNRNALDEWFQHELLRARRFERPLSVIILDIDHFKAINDSQGHLVGDQVLRAMASLLQANLRETDKLFRWGGEEFLVICSETPREAALSLAQRLLEQVRSKHFEPGGRLTVSAGVACLQTQGGAPDGGQDLFQRADQALYRAKHAGRDRVESCC